MDIKILYVWLNRINGIGPVLASNLIDFFKRIDNYNELIKVEGIGHKLAKTIVESKCLQKCNEIYYMYK